MDNIIDFQTALPERQFNGKRLEIARVYRGLGSGELADLVGLKRQTISMYESSKAVNPEVGTLHKISQALNFPIRFFLENNLIEAENSPTYFRSLLTTGKKYRREQEAKVYLVKGIYGYLSGYLKFRELNLPKLDQAMGIEDAAMALREYWGLGRKPIDNLTYIAESHGLVVFDFNSSTSDVDAFSHKVQIGSKETFLIGYSRNKNIASRVHFDIAHELGHILLHNWDIDIENIEKAEFKELEQEANNFASAFLLPREEFIADIGKYASNLSYYVEMKKRWKVSIAAMIRRSFNLNLINNDEYQRLMRSMQKKGIRKQEPLDDVLITARPSLLRESVNLLINKKVVTPKIFLEELSLDCGITMYSDDIEELLGLKKGILKIEAIPPKLSLELKFQT
jgi:Zn-dependent peptidase ImmA (M78 family)/DNA-binding XRE family transcriptional regulator